MRRSSQGGGGRGGGQPPPQPCQRSRSSATMFKTRNEASSAFPYGRPPTSHGRNFNTSRSLRGGWNNSNNSGAKFDPQQFNFNARSETRNAFALSRPNSYRKISSRFNPPPPPQQPLPHSSSASRSRPVAPAITSFAPDPSYDSTLGGGVVSSNHQQFNTHNYNSSSNNRPLRNCHSTSTSSRSRPPTWRLNPASTSASTISHAPPPKREGNMVSSSSNSVVSKSQSQVSLLDQKKRQWAQEREELSGLWSPWGKEKNISSQSEQQQQYPSDHAGDDFSLGGGFPRPGGHFATYSASDHYLPPINDPGHQQNLRPAQRSHSLIPGGGGNDLDINRLSGGGGDIAGRKVSLPDGGRRVVQLQPYEQRTTFHKEGNAEWMIIHNGNGDGPPSLSPSMGGDNGHDRTAVISPRVIVHKIVMDASEERNSISRIGPYDGDAHTVESAYSEGDTYQHQHPYHHPLQQQSSPQPPSSTYPVYHGDDRGTGNPLTRSSQQFGGSTGYLGNKPPPVAMRSHLSIGLPSPRSRFGGSFEDIEKKEKQQWLHELEMQREEQRLRKLTEKDDKRARWGDKGVGVGHFWEPSSDSSRARLPSSNGSGTDGGGSGSGRPSPPAWAKRSIEMQSLSQPNLYNGPLPAQMTVSEDNNMMNGRGGQSQGHIANFNRSSIELSDHSRSPGGGGGDQQRTFLRGQNIPLDLNEAEERERERKTRARQEYLEDVKKQIEDNKRRQKEEKEKQEREDREHERRMEQQRELEIQRLEMEKRKKNPQYGSTDSSNMGESGIQIFEGRPLLHINNTTLESESPLHESPLIPNNRFIPEPDAYELAIARRQAMTLSQLQQSQSTEKSESGMTSLSSETERNYSNNNIHTNNTEKQHSSTPTPPTVVEAFHHHRMNDQCLMTDSDHIYERTLTPTQERRSRSMDFRQVAREFGTQTEVSDLTTDIETDREHGQNNNKQQNNNEHSSSNNKRSKSISNLHERENNKKEEKPRWGSNPDKKVYIKQSEKDPNYQKKLKRRQQTSGGNELMHHYYRHNNNNHGSGSGSFGETDTTTVNEYENENNPSIPFHRIQNRVRERARKSRSPLKAQTPLNNNHNNSYSQNHNYLVHGYSGQSQSHISSHLKTEDEFLQPADTRSSVSKGMTKNKAKSKSPPKIVRVKTNTGMDKVLLRSTSDHHILSGSDDSVRTAGGGSSIAQKHLGHIRDGLNSIGGSEESCTGSGFTSPSSLLPSKTRPNCSTGDSNNSSSHPSSASASNSSDYIPIFSKDFKSQRDFDEMPIGGVKANPYLENAFIGNMANVNPVVKRHMDKIKSSAASMTKPKAMNNNNHKPSPMAAPPLKPKSRERNQNQNQKEMDKRKSTVVNKQSERQRIFSPPVPALAKKLELGLLPDLSGRLSSFPPELLSPIPTIPLGAVVGSYLDYDPNPSLTDGSRLSSAEPKVDIDIAITHASNPDLQELLHNIEQSAAASSATLTARSEGSQNNNNNNDPSLLSAREDELAQLISARSGISGKGGSTRPVTNATDLSIQAQEEFIRDLMSNREVQQQLSAREGELSEKGIIEFNIRLPSSFAPSALTSGKSRKAASSRSRGGGEPIMRPSSEATTTQPQIYRDPLLTQTERRKATVQWLHSLDESSSSDNAILTNLSSLKQGIKMQQHELVYTSSDIYQ